MLYISLVVIWFFIVSIWIFYIVLYKYNISWKNQSIYIVLFFLQEMCVCVYMYVYIFLLY